MQELEKTLEEIDFKITRSMGRKREGLLEAEEIIRKHLSRENDSETMRLSRDTEGTNEEINLSKEEFDMLRFDDSVTFRCGNEYVSLYMWEDEATRKYKHMDDGWIPVDKNNMPDHEILACDRYDNELIGYLGYNADAEEFVCESDECIMYQVIAWMEKPEPYRTERSDGK